MKPKHLCRIGAVIVLSFLVLLLGRKSPRHQPHGGVSS